MSRGDHLVIDKLFGSAHVTAQTGVTSDRYVAEIDHAELFLLVGRLIFPTLDRMRPQPAGSGAVTALATHTVAQIKGLGALFGGNREGMTGQTFLILFRRRRKIKDAPDAKRNIVGKNLIGASVFVLPGPDTVLILRNVSDLFGLNTAVATAGGAASGAVVLSHRRSLAGGSDEAEGHPHAGYTPEIFAAGRAESEHSRFMSERYRAMIQKKAIWLCLYPFHPAKSIDSVVRGENRGRRMPEARQSISGENLCRYDGGQSRDVMMQS